MLAEGVLSDLSPAATFIAYNLNSLSYFRDSVPPWSEVISETESTYGEIYSVFDESVNSEPLGKAMYTIWSDVFICPNCASEVTWWEPGTGEQKAQIVEPTCPNCGVQVPKREENRQFETLYDAQHNSLYKHVKRKPVLINSVYPNGKRVDRLPSSRDLAWIAQHNQVPLELEFPSNSLTKGERYYKDGLHLINVERFDQFFMPRNLTALAAFRRDLTQRNLRLRGDFLITSVLQKTASIMHNVGLKSGRINLAGALPNVLYVPSTIAERNIFVLLRFKLRDIISAAAQHRLVTNATALSISDSVILVYFPITL